MTRFWLLSLPLPHREDADGGHAAADEDRMTLYSHFKDKLAVSADIASLYRIPLPDFKVGTLDTLVSSGEELARLDPLFEGAVTRLVKNLANALLNDLNSSQPNLDPAQKPDISERLKSILRVHGTHSLSTHVKSFRWNSLKYRADVPILDTVRTLEQEMDHIDSLLKVKLGAHTIQRNALADIERRTTGSFHTRNLTSYMRDALFSYGIMSAQSSSDNLGSLSEKSVFSSNKESPNVENDEKINLKNESNAEGNYKVDENSPKKITLPCPFEEDQTKGSEYITALLVIVPKNEQIVWESSYERLVEMVIPRSSHLMAEEDSLLLYSVAIMSRAVDAFLKAASEKKWNTKRCFYDARTEAADTSAKDALLADAASQRAQILRLLETNFGELFSAWVHVKMLRLFVESVLRYGLPPHFLYISLRLPDQPNSATSILDTNRKQNSTGGPRSSHTTMTSDEKKLMRHLLSILTNLRLPGISSIDLAAASHDFFSGPVSSNSQKGEMQSVEEAELWAALNINTLDQTDPFVRVPINWSF